MISINLVSLKGGIAESATDSFENAKFIMNLQPATAEAGFDMRLPPMSSAEMDAVERMIREEWAPAALNFTVAFTIQARVTRGAAATLQLTDFHLCLLQAKRLAPDGSAAVTSMNADENPWWGAFTASMAAQGLEIQPEIFPAATDASYLRVKGIPSLGFSPMRCVHDAPAMRMRSTAAPRPGGRPSCCTSTTSSFPWRRIAKASPSTSASSPTSQTSQTRERSAARATSCEDHAGNCNRVLRVGSRTAA